MSGRDSRLAPLRKVKLRALVRDHWKPGDDLEDGGLPGGATLREVDGPRGWVLVDDGALSGFGAALAWGRRHRRRELHVLVEDRAPESVAGLAARRAGEFMEPPLVWRVRDRDVERAVAAPPGPDRGSVGVDEVPAALLDSFAKEIVLHGADPIVEHGVLRAEVLGLEVARAVPDGVGGWRLATGVGRHDREAREEFRPGEPTGAALDDVVALVRLWRTAGERRHPANTLARERLLRAAVVRHPELAGAASLTPVAPPVARDDLRDSVPAGAVGLDVAGAPIVVVCSTGIDVDLVPTAADTRLLHAPGAHLVLVLPTADAYPVTRALAAALRQPAEVRTVDDDWPRLATN